VGRFPSLEKKKRMRQKPGARLDRASRSAPLDEDGEVLKGLAALLLEEYPKFSDGIKTSLARQDPRAVEDEARRLSEELEQIMEETV
jgi:hypothetical protein